MYSLQKNNSLEIYDETEEQLQVSMGVDRTSAIPDSVTADSAVSSAAGRPPDNQTTSSMTPSSALEFVRLHAEIAATRRRDRVNRSLVCFVPEQRGELSIDESLILNMLMGERKDEYLSFVADTRRRNIVLLRCVVKFLGIIHRLRERETGGWVV
jgi:hypothetical protein